MVRDPWQGNSREPISFHGFLYTDNNPVNSIDPSGYCSQSGWDDSDGLFTEENCDRIESGDLAFTEEWYSDFADYVEPTLPQTAAHFRHFLSGAGGQLQLPSSFVQDIALNIGRFRDSIRDLSEWYIQKHIDDLSVCIVTPVGPDIYARGFTPNYAQVHPIGGFFLGTYNGLTKIGQKKGGFKVDLEP